VLHVLIRPSSTGNSKRGETMKVAGDPAADCDMFCKLKVYLLTCLQQIVHIIVAPCSE
jgi:hypothetical protein